MCYLRDHKISFVEKHLLITHYLIQEILVDVVFDIHVRGVRIKKFHDLYVVTMHLLYKGFVEKYHMLLTRP